MLWILSNKDLSPELISLKELKSIVKLDNAEQIWIKILLLHSLFLTSNVYINTF